MKKNRFPMAIKVLVFYVSFMLLHYLYDWFPNTITMIFSGINESVYQHMKIAFFVCVFTSTIEYLTIKQAIQSRSRFFISRIFTTSYLPLLMMVIFLICPIVFGKIETIAGEIIWANIALLSTAIFSFEIEKHFEKSDPSNFMIGIVIFIFLLSLVQFVVFTFELPWFDILATPPGW
ncbi:MAG: hypothetical protein K0B14_14415 [Anaerolineaceae bacterium]|nr:hypothetical protein [Anaerolineaceae bacterium]